MLITVILGSNSGDKRELIEKATRELELRAGEAILLSSFYETEPWGFECDEAFFNRVVVYQTTLSPSDFLAVCLDIEQQLGRIRHENAGYESRTIDIDILFCDSLIIDTPELAVPHPRIASRNFVLVPLAEIMPDFVHPLVHSSIRTLLEGCSDTCKVRLLKPVNSAY